MKPVDGSAAEVSDIDTFELELRKLAGVGAVGFSEYDGDLTVHLTVPLEIEHRHVYADAAELARLCMTRPVRVVIEPFGDASPRVSPGDASRLPTSRLHSVPPARDDRGERYGWSAHEARRMPEPEPTPDPAPASLPHPTALAPEAGGSSWPSLRPPPAPPPTGEPRAAPAAPQAPADMPPRTDKPRITDVGSRLSATPGPSPPGRPPRVELLGVQLAGGGREVEVRLILDGVRSVGRGPAGRPSAVVMATMDALQQLGWPIPFTVRNAVRLAMGVDGAVAVSLGGPGGDRLGLSRGSTVEEAAAKATLHALNRYLGETRHHYT